MIGMKLLCANGLSPTASPITSPIATESAKATASSQNVMRKAAGTPRVSNTAGSDANARDGLPDAQQENDDGDARDPRSPQRPPPCARVHHGRFPRASSADTSALRIAAIATTKAI